MSDDLMFQNEIRDIVRAAYGAITTGAGAAMAHRFYSEEELANLDGDALPDDAVAIATQCGLSGG